MKRIRSISVVVCLVAVLLLTNTAHADLNLIGQGTSTYGTYNLIYDTDLNITWYDYSNAINTWENQMDWADSLSVTFGSNIYNDWRLPTSLNQDGSGPCSGYNCTGSEMGHLYYTELGNVASPSSPTGLSNTGDFQNLQPGPGLYWSGTEYCCEGEGDLPRSWYFNFPHGQQYHNDWGGHDYAIAVMSGMAIVPEPISSILFITGGTLLAGRKYLRRKKTL